MLHPELLIYVHIPIYTLLKWEQPGGFLSKFNQGAWLAESRSAFTRILAHQPPGQLPLPYPLEPGSGEDVRATGGQHLSAAESREQRNPSSPSFPLALHFLPSHLPSSLALLFLFSHFPSPPRKPHPHLNPQPLKFSLFMAWSQKS